MLKKYVFVNIGYGRRISYGISWTFEAEEETIVFEDDCVSDDTFFGLVLVYACVSDCDMKMVDKGFLRCRKNDIVNSKN